MYGQVSDVLQAQSFIIRNEQVIDESANGVLSYRVADGTRVAQGGVIADVFSTEEDASAQRTIEQLDEEIANRKPALPLRAGGFATFAGSYLEAFSLQARADFLRAALFLWIRFLAAAWSIFLTAI